MVERGARARAIGGYPKFLNTERRPHADVRLAIGSETDGSAVTSSSILAKYVYIMASMPSIDHSKA